MNDVATEIGRIVGKTLAVAEAPTSSMVATLIGYGVPKEMAELYREMTDAIVEGRIVWEPGHEHVPGKTPVGEVLRGLLGK